MTESVTPFHSVATIIGILNQGNFTKLEESETWDLKAGGKYYFTRNESSICAFVCGTALNGTTVDTFKIVGTHTDSPCLRIAPISDAPRYGFE